MDNERKNTSIMTSLIRYLYSNFFSVIFSSKSNCLPESPSEPDFSEKENKLKNLGANDFGILTGPESMIDCSVSMGCLNKLVGGRLVEVWFEKEDTQKGISSNFLIEKCESDNVALSKCDKDDINTQNEFTPNYKLKEVSLQNSKSRDENSSGPSGDFEIEKHPLGEFSSKHYIKNNCLIFPGEAEHVRLPKNPLEDLKKNHFSRDPNGNKRKFPTFPPNLWSQNDILDHLGEQVEDLFPAEADDDCSTSTEDEMIFHMDDVECEKKGPTKKSDKSRSCYLVDY